MKRVKTFVFPASVVLLSASVLTFAMTLLFTMGRAAAQSDVPAPNGDPTASFLDLYEFIKTGRGTLAAGAAGMIAVWALRHLFGKKVAWFKTRAGGYVLGLSTAAVEYGSVALLANQTPTVTLAINALGSAFVAAGGWEALRDVINSTKNTTIVAKAASVGTVAVLVLVLVAMPSCATTGGAPRRIVGGALVDCLAADRGAINDLVDEFAPLITEGRADWPSMYSRAKSAGLSVGGCFLAEIVAIVTSPRRGLITRPLDETTPRALLELFRREEADGSVFKTERGEY